MTIQDANLGPVGNVHIEGGTAGQVLTSTGNSGVTWANPSTDVHVIDWAAGDGSPVNTCHARFQHDARYDTQGGSTPYNNPLSRIVYLTSPFENTHGTLSWWYPLQATDAFTIRATTQAVKVSIDQRVQDNLADGITMYFGSTLDGYWKIGPGLSVTLDEYGADFNWVNATKPSSVLWFQNGNGAIFYGCPSPNWNLYDTNNGRYFWQWVTTETTWNPTMKRLSVVQNGTLVSSIKIDNPNFGGGWVGLYGFCGALIGQHNVKDFRLTIHNNPNASPVGPYPTGPQLTTAVLPTHPLAKYSSDTDTVTLNLKKPYWHFLKRIT